MIKMGRKSTAQLILEELPKADSLDQSYLVIYDFHGGPPNPKFYSNLGRISELTEDGSSLVQFSVYRTTSAKAALAVHALAAREGAEVAIYMVEESSPEVILEHLETAQAPIQGAQSK